MEPSGSSSQPPVKIASRCGVYRLIFVNKFPNKLQFAWSTIIAMDGDISISMTFACINNHQPPIANSSEWRTIRNPVLQHLVPNPIVRQDDPSVGTLDKMFVPDGFSIDTIAMEPRLHQPMAFTFDSRGRLWVVEGYCYPQKRPEGEGLDRIVIFADQDGDGSFEDRKVFQEGLNLVSGLEVGHGGVWVGAAPELLFIPDRNHDDVPDAAPKVLLDGFGYADTHETMNSFLWGPDGWLYGNQGVFNTSMIGKPGAIDADRIGAECRRLALSSYATSFRDLCLWRQQPMGTRLR